MPRDDMPQPRNVHDKRYYDPLEVPRHWNATDAQFQRDRRFSLGIVLIFLTAMGTTVGALLYFV